MNAANTTFVAQLLLPLTFLNFSKNCVGLLHLQEIHYCVCTTTVSFRNKRYREYFTLLLKGYYLPSKARNEWVKEPLAEMRTETSRYYSFPVFCFLFLQRKLISLLKMHKYMANIPVAKPTEVMILLKAQHAVWSFYPSFKIKYH